MTAAPEDVRAATQVMAGHLRSGMLVLMVDLGHRLGLCEAAAGAGPLTAAELAERAGCTTRSVEEWLGSVTTGGLFRFVAPDRYELPDAMAAVLSGGGSGDLSRVAANVTTLAPVVPRAVEAFRTGEGIDYPEFPGFHQLMDQESRPLFDEVLVSGYLAACGPAVAQRLAAGGRALDLGCGTGHAMVVLAQAFPAADVLGIDLGAAAIERGRAEAAALAVDNVRFEVGDALGAATDEPYDLVCAFDAVHDQVDPAGLLALARRAVGDDGTFLMVDIKARTGVEANLTHPMGPWLYAISALHCTQVSLAGGGPGLGTCWGEEQATAMLRAAGFGTVEVHRVAADRTNLVYVARP